ncbi:MAG: ABC transporter permease [Defluviitaleaceae bacterium]|nr:ABC transporter permease [Defluviitaleaceae bacterium]
MFRIIWREIYHDKLALTAFITFVGIIAAAFAIAAGIDEHQAGLVTLQNMNRPPGTQFPLGTDPAGRCMVGQLFLGARNSFLIAFAVTIASGAIGVIFGLVSGFAGGNTDNVIMRLLDFFLMLPALLIMIAVLSVLGSYGVWQFSLIMIAFLWADRARLMRAKTMQQAGLDYVSASKTLGTPNIIVMLREVLPNLTSVITVNMTLTLAANMGLETGLTFLGYGLPYGTPSLGTLISYAAVPTAMIGRPWQWLPAALLIFVMMLSIYVVGQAISRAVDAKQRRAV